MNREPTNQVLLDRYVYTISTMLSPEEADDVTAEIRSNLESQREDQALILGRDLSSEELSAILKQHGHPMLVARRYRDAGWGVSPELFAFYRFSLGGLLALIFAILWCAGFARNRVIRITGAVLTLALCIGIWKDWKVPALPQLDLLQQAAILNAAKPGQDVMLPVYPGGD